MSAINIDFEVFFYMVVGLFGLVGFMRGWWKEAITTGLLVFLLLLLERPDLAVIIIDGINGLLEWVRGTDVFSATGAVDPPPDIDPSTSQFYIVTLIVLIVVSYFLGRAGIGDTTISSGGRLFGGILGLTNGFIALSLTREYIVRRFLPDSGISAATALPTEITFTVSNIPRTTITEGTTAWVVIIAGAIVLFGALGTRYKLNKGKVSKLVPPGYVPPPSKGAPAPLEAKIIF